MTSIRNNATHGLTLVELLVVISIIVLLAGVTVPMMQPALQGRDVREAARELNAFIAGAQSRAVGIGRPVGVWFERELNSPHTGYRCFMAEVPRPYSGDTDQARVVIQPLPSNAQVIVPPQFLVQNYGEFLLYIAEVVNPADALVGTMTLVETPAQPGEYNGQEIRFNRRGPRFPLIDLNRQGNTIRYIFLAPTASLPPLSVNGRFIPVPFEIYRAPQKTSAQPIELPVGTAIDFTASGWGLNRIFDPPDPTMAPQPLIVMFDPQLGVNRVFNNGETVVLPSTQSLMVLIGHSDQVPTDVTPGTIATITGTDKPANLLDSGSLWVTINIRSGRANTAENIGTENATATMTPLQIIELARQLAFTDITARGR